MSRNDEQIRAEHIVMVERASERGDCEKCFKAFDQTAPSCNDGECVARWNARVETTQALDGKAMP